MRHFFAAVVVALALAFGGAAVFGQADSTVYQPGDGVALPVVVKSVQPAYTSEALQQRIEGRVGLLAVVRPDGHVTDIEVEQSLDSVYGLDKQAVEALRQWEFKPGTRNKQPVAVQIHVAMNFTLK